MSEQEVIIALSGKELFYTDISGTTINAGTGNFAAGSDAALSITAGSVTNLAVIGSVGFYNTVPIAQQTSVGANAGAILDSLIALGLVTGS